MKLNFDFSPWISPVSGNIAFWQSFPDLPVNYTIEGDRENRPQPSSALIDIRLDIIDLRHAIDNLEQRPYPDLNATYILQQPDANLPNAQALNQLNNGLMKNNNGVIQIAIPNQDYLTPSLPSGQLWIGNNNNIATPQQMITIDNLPSLGTTDVPNPFTGGFVGQVWEGTSSGRPEASSIVGEMFADIAILNAKFLAGHFVMNSGLTASFPAAQFLNALTAGALVQTSALGDGKLVSVVVQQDQVLMGGVNNMPESRARIGVENLPLLAQNRIWVGDVNSIPQSTQILDISNLPNLNANNLWVGGVDNRPAPQATIAVQNLPSLTSGRVWQGDATNRPIETQLNFAPSDATYIIKTSNANLPQAQVLSELGIGMAKIVAGGAFAIAIAGEDYATAEQLQEIEQQCQQYAEQASTSATEAGTSATEAAASATEATASATAAAGSATAAGGSATAAGGSATAAGLSAAGAAASAITAGVSAGSASSSASSASSSASDASHSASNAGQSATNAANSATQAQTYLNTLLTTGLTLQGDVNGSGLLSSPIVTTFKPNPTFTGNQSMTMPSGNSSQRPTMLIPGMIRFNTAL